MISFSHIQSTVLELRKNDSEDALGIPIRGALSSQRIMLKGLRRSYLPQSVVYVSLCEGSQIESCAHLER